MIFKTTQASVPSILLMLLSNACFALQWSWDKKEEEQRQSGFTSQQVQERDKVNQNTIGRQLLGSQKGTIVYSGLDATYADLYDENGMAVRIDLDQNHDGKVGADDFLLVSRSKGSKTGENEPKNIWEQLYTGRIQEESNFIVKEMNTRKTEIEQIDQNLLPGIEKTERLLIKDLLGFQNEIAEIEEHLLRFGVAISKDEDGTEQVQIPEKLSQVSTVKKFLLERRQLLIQTAKIKNLIEAQELYRSQQLKRKRELEKEIQELAKQQSELELEQSKFRP